MALKPPPNQQQLSDTQGKPSPPWMQWFSNVTRFVNEGGGGGGSVTSVNGKTGVVVLDTDDISEGTTNLYFTEARVNELKSSTTVTRVTSSQSVNDSFYQWNGNTDAGDVTLTLPAGVSGATFRFVNTGTSGNELTIAPNGSELLLGDNSSFFLNDGEALIVTYQVTDGWY